MRPPDTPDPITTKSLVIVPSACLEVPERLEDPAPHHRHGDRDERQEEAANGRVAQHAFACPALTPQPTTLVTIWGSTRYLRQTSWMSRARIERTLRRSSSSLTCGTP